jgi:hypothetical protein
MKPFAYERAGETAEALALHTEHAAYLAGGTNLVDLMRLGVADDARPAVAVLLEHARRGAQLPGRAVTALERVMLDERRLQRVQVRVARQAFDRGHLGPVVRDGQDEAGVDPPAVQQHRARAALPLVAALLRPGQREVIAQEVQQAGPRVDGKPVRFAVDTDGDARVHAAGPTHYPMAAPAQS